MLEEFDFATLRVRYLQSSAEMLLSYAPDGRGAADVTMRLAASSHEFQVAPKHFMGAKPTSEGVTVAVG